MRTNSRSKGSYDHQHLLIKECKEEMKKYQLGIRAKLLEMSINYYDMTTEQKKEILHRVVKAMSQEESGMSFIDYVKDRVKEQVDHLYSSESRKHTYLVDCLRQSMSFPIVKENDEITYNFADFHKQILSKELRRLMWTKHFNNNKNRMLFQKYDRQITPYNVQEELKIGIDRIVIKQEIKFKEVQKDIALRVMQYFVKSNNKIPHKYHNYIAISVVELFSFYGINKVLDIGATCLGLISLIEYYYEPDLQVKYERLINIMQIVDGQTFSFIKNNFLTGQKQAESRRTLNQCYEYFRLTMGASLLPIQVSQFIVDQLIIRKKCKIDSYTVFAITILIISDEFTEEEIGKSTLKEIIQRAKHIVTKEDFAEAFSVIYEFIPAYYSFDDFEQHANNRLLSQMLASETAKIENPDEQNDDFVVNLTSAARMGHRF